MGEADREAADLHECWWSAASGDARVGPVAGDEPAVPADHRLGLHDQHDLRQTRPYKRGGQDGEDRAVRVGEARPIELSLQHQDLMAQGEDLCVALVASREQPSEPTDQKVTERRGEVHRQQNVSIEQLENVGYSMAMDFRHVSMAMKKSPLVAG